MSSTRRTGLLGVVTSLALAAGLLTVQPALASPRTAGAPTLQHDTVVAGHSAAAMRAPEPRVRTSHARPFTAPRPAWPAASTADITVRRTATMARTAPVWLASVPANTKRADIPVTQSFRLQVFSHAAAMSVGISGIMLALTRTGAGPAGPVRVGVDYAAFRGAFGGGWALRLRLIELTGCSRLLPVPSHCRLIALHSANDVTHGRLTAIVAPPARSAGSTMVLAATAGASGGAGSFAATTLSPSGSWSVGGATGDFQWSYPLRMPPAVGGPSPKLSLSYDSAGVDGQTAATNNQPSWVGEGFDLAAGYVERSYAACSDEMGSGANNSTATGDLCWAGDNATLSLGGHSGELIRDPNDPDRWHLRNDDGTFIEHLTGAGNGAQNGEYWRVTTPDGVQFYFGSTPSANSTLTEPVYGNKQGEPCYQASFAASSCTQGYRWNLDKMVDTSGNTVTYKYAVETNEYAADDNPDSPVSYDRAGYLTEIDYGTTNGSSATPPIRVRFTTGPRCVTSNCGAHDAADWPDTPWDQQCTSAPCLNGSPTFWSDIKLDSITTELYSGTGTTYTPVTTWKLTHTFPDPGDGTPAGMWLASIQESGQDGGTASLPPVTFTPVQLQNRVDPIGLGLPPMNWMRIAQITSETGAQTQVSYSPIDCTPGSRMPSLSDLQDNPYRCYPVIWTPPGQTSPITDFFNKYVVTSVNVADLTTPGNPATTTSYQYLGSPAWHYSDSGDIPPDKRTWSDWRGYGDVKTTTGTGADASVTENLYFRGMNGDHLPSGTRTVTLSAVDMNNDGNSTDPADAPSAPDDDTLNGTMRETMTWNGTALVKATVYNPWESAPTATVTTAGVTVNAMMTGVSDARTETVLDGGRAPRTTSTHTDYDPVFGQPVDTQDNGDDAVTGDETCKLITYDRHTSTDGSIWITALASRVQDFATTCAVAKAGNLAAAQVIDDSLTYFDGATSISAPPARGMVTRVDELKDWVNGSPVYYTAAQSQFDALGRITSSTDDRGNTTTTSYTLNAGGQQVTATQTNVLGWVTTNTVDPGTGQIVQSVDPNGRVTSESYDPFGHLTGVWQPGRDKATQSPNVSYSYLIRNNAPTVVTTSKLLPNGGYLSSYALYDGLLRARQTQAPRGDRAAGALITDTFYDTAGRATLVTAPYLASVTPGTSLFVANMQSDVPRYATTAFDGAGRPIRSTVSLNTTGTPTAYAATTTSYGGDRVDVTPPPGTPATSTITDARGNVTELRQYHGAAPTPFAPGSYDATDYTYNAKNRLVRVTDAAGNIWTTSYDVHGHVVSTTDPDNGTVTTAYNDAGDVTSTTDARGITLNYTYDQLGRETGIYRGSVAPANELSSYTYDGLPSSRGQLTSSTSFDGGNAYTSSVLGFNAAYQPTAVRYSIPAAEAGLAGNYTYVYTYNPDGSLNTTRMPSLDGGAMPTETLTQGYTPLGQPYSLSTSLPTATTLVPSTAYTGYGELNQMTLQTNGGSSAWITLDYTPGTRTLAEQLISRQTSPTAIADTHYSYDQSGNPTEITDSVSGDSQCFSYDYLDRLVSAWTPASGDCTAAKTVAALGGPAPYWTDWTYNTTGTRTSQTQHDLASVTTYTVPAPQADQPHTITSATTVNSAGTSTVRYAYDGSGDTTSRPDGAGGTQTLTWNALGHLATLTDGGQSTSYTYDVNGNRLIERDNTGKTLYLPGQELRYTVSSGTLATTRYYSQDGQTIAMRTSAGLTWLAGDAQGSVNITIDAVTQATSIRRQDPFGSLRGALTGTRPPGLDKGYVGGTTDATGLTHLGAREYDAALGRFLSVDPVLDKSKPQRFDGYAYCADNPVTAADPLGTDPPSGPPSGAPTGNGWGYVFFDVSDVGFLDYGGFRFFYGLEWYAWCQAGGNQLTCLGDPSQNMLYVYSDGQDYVFAIFRLAPPPPPPVTCTNQPVFYMGPADPANQIAPQNQAAQNCNAADWSCTLNDWEGAASDDLCNFIHMLCQAVQAGMDPIGTVGNLLNGRDGGNAIPDLIGLGAGFFSGDEEEAAGADMLHGIGPIPGVLEVSARSKAVGVFEHYFPSVARDFVYDPESETLLVATYEAPKVIGHDFLIGVGGFDENAVGAGMFTRGPDGEYLTYEWSGHHGQNWNKGIPDELRLRFLNFMSNYGFTTTHSQFPD